MSEAIHSAPAPAPQMPKGPLLGTGPAPTHLGLNATKGTGAGAHQKNTGNGQGRPQSSSAMGENEGDALMGDYALLNGGSSHFNPSMTIHEAFSRLGGANESVSFSPSQLAELKRLLDRPHPRIEGQERAESHIVGALEQQSWVSLRHTGAPSEGDMLQDEVPLSPSQLRSLPQPLQGALKRPFVGLRPGDAPETAQEEAALFLLTTDPRAGFAPEGVAAFLARRRGLQLKRAGDALNDFIDKNSGEPWHIVPVRDRAARPIAEIQAAVNHALSVGAHLLLDASHLSELDGALAVAVRELGTTIAPVKLAVAFGPTMPVVSAG